MDLLFWMALLMIGVILSVSIIMLIDMWVYPDLISLPSHDARLFLFSSCEITSICRDASAMPIEWQSNN